MKKYFAVIVNILAACLLLLVGCGSQTPTDDTKAEPEAAVTEHPIEQVTRGKWISMLGEAFGLDTYESNTPYYSDIQPSHPLFPYIQAAAEWGILSDFSDDTFSPDKNITREEAAKTASFAAGYTGDDAVDFAVKIGIISGGVQSDNLSRAESEKSIEAAREYYFSPQEETLTVKRNSDIVNISTYATETTENVITTTDSIDVEAGDIVLTAPTAEHPFGVAYKVTGITESGEQTTIAVTTPELGDLYDEISVHATVAADLNKIIWANGVTVYGDEASGVSFDGTMDGGFMLLTANQAAQPQLALLAEETGTYSRSFPIKISSGDYSKTWTGKNSSVLGDKASILENSNFIYDGIPSIDDFSGSDAPWSKALAAENKFSAGYNITGTLDIKEITVTADVEYTKILHLRKPTNSLTVTADIAANLAIEGNLSGRLRIAQIPIPIGATGLTVSVNLYLYADASGSLQVEAELEYMEKAEKSGLLLKHAESGFDMKADVSAAVDLEFGADLAVSLDALGAVQLIDIGIKAGADLAAEATVIGQCETATADGITTKTYTESMNIEAALYLPIAKLYIGGDDTVVSSLGISEDWEWEIIGKESAHKYSLYDESWIFWTETVVIDANGNIIEDEVTTAGEMPLSESDIYAQVLNGDFSFFAGDYIPYEMFKAMYSFDPPSEVSLDEQGRLIGDMGLHDFTGITPVSIELNEDGSIKCTLIYEDDERNNYEAGGAVYGRNIYYIIYPVGIESSFYPTFGSDEVRIHFLWIQGGIYDTLYYKTNT